tara:strand:- start:187 stop:1023 length:837 start_codon:yes stop_codon:yes gene_type:complete
MLFSLIVPTLNRKKYLINLLKSLENQDLKNFEVIIIDQNPVEFLKDIISEWGMKINIIYKNVNFKGACKARNYGAKFANGEYIAFPDDDTEYSRDVLSLVAEGFKSIDDADILITNCLDHDSSKAVLNKINKKVFLIKSIYGLLKERIVTSQIFLKSSMFENSSYIFDEMMGPGACTPYASNDETDLLIRALKDKKKIYLNRNILIFHPTNYPHYQKAYLYGLGRFRLIQKHNLGISFYLINILQPVIRLIYSFKFKNTKSFIASSLGRAGIHYFLKK